MRKRRPAPRRVESLSAQLGLLDQALGRAASDPLSESSAAGQRAILISEGRQIAAAFAQIVATARTGRRALRPNVRRSPVRTCRSSASRFRPDRPFRSSAAKGAARRRPRALRRAGRRRRPDDSRAPRHDRSDHPDRHRRDDPDRGANREDLWTVGAGIRSVAAVPGRDSPRPVGRGLLRARFDFAKLGALEIHESRKGVYAYGYVPAGITSVESEAARFPLSVGSLRRGCPAES